MADDLQAMLQRLQILAALHIAKLGMNVHSRRRFLEANHVSARAQMLRRNSYTRTFVWVLERDLDRLAVVDAEDYISARRSILVVPLEVVAHGEDDKRGVLGRV